MNVVEAMRPVLNNLQLNESRLVGTPAEFMADHATRFRVPEGEEGHLHKHGISLLAGELDYAIHSKTIPGLTMTGSVGLRLNGDRHALDCEFGTVLESYRADLPYPDAYCFVSESSTYRRPHWFLIVETEPLYVSLQTMVKTLLGDHQAALRLSCVGVDRREEQQEGWFDHCGNVLRFDLEALRRLEVPVYVQEYRGPER